MNRIELKKFMILGLVAAMTAACGSSSDSTNPSTAVSNPPSSSANTSPTTPVTNPVVSATPAPSVNGCPQYPSRSFYSYAISGQNVTSYQTTVNEIVADSKLRVSITPQASTTIQGKYTLMAGTVSLVRWTNGVGTVVASQNFPTPSTQAASDYYSYKVGVPIGYQTAPANLDFSASLGGGSKYSIKVTNVLTDKHCTDFCSPSSPSYSGHCSAYGTAAAQYCSYYQGSGYTWTLDYMKNQWYCCDGPQVQSCQQTYCGVGAQTGISNANIAFTVKVETDNTSCIQ